MSQRVARVCCVCGKDETGRETAGIDGASYRCASCCAGDPACADGGPCACDTCGETYAAEFVQDHGGVLICRNCLLVQPSTVADRGLRREEGPRSYGRSLGRPHRRVRSLAFAATLAAATVVAVVAWSQPHEPDYPAKVQPLLWKMAEVRSMGAHAPFGKFVAEYPELYASLERQFTQTEGTLSDQEKARKSWQYVRDTMRRFPRARRGPARAMPQYEQAVQAALTNVDGKLFCAVGYLQRGE